MPGADHILDKSFLMTGSSAVALGTVAKVATGTTLQPAQAALATAATDIIVGVFQENVDADKVTTGKAYVNVRMMGISHAIAGGAVAMGDYVTATTGGKMITTTTAANRVVGMAMSAAAADGDIFTVFLMIGSKVGA
jgi:hypothetical protein